MKFTKYALSFSLLTASSFAVSNTVMAKSATTQQTSEVTKPVTVHTKANVDSEAIGTLKKGTIVQSFGTDKYGWVEIEFNGEKAYIYKDFVKASTKKVSPTPTKTTAKTPAKKTTTTKYVKKNVTVREKASVDGKQLGTLKTGTKITVYSTSKTGWVKIAYNQKTAYVYKDYVTTTKPKTVAKKAPTTVKSPAKNTSTGFALNTAKTYTYVLNGQKTTLTSKGKKNADGYKIWTMTTNGKKTTVYLKETAKKGLFMKIAGQDKVQLLPYPYAVNETYKNGSVVYKVIDHSVTVKTKAGTFKNVVKVKAANNTYYIAPNTGVIKVLKGSKTIFELTTIK